MWTDDDANWQSGTYTCPWAATAPVRSVLDNISGDRGFSGVAYYRGADFAPVGHDRARSVQRTGCTGVNSMGNHGGHVRGALAQAGEQLLLRAELLVMGVVVLVSPLTRACACRL